LAGLLLCGSPSWSSEPDAAPPALDTRVTPDLGDLLAQGKDKKDKEDKTKSLPPPVKEPPKQPAPEAPPTDIFAQSPTAGAEAPSGFNPLMIGDPPPLFFGLRSISVTGLQTTQSFQSVTTTTVVIGPAGDRMIVTTTSLVAVTQQQQIATTNTVRVPILGPAAFKIAENESPLPQDRVFLTYNFYDNVHGPASGLPHAVTVNTTVNGLPATITTQIPGVSQPNLNVNRGVVGFEKTFLGGDASFELRAPMIDQEGDPLSPTNALGDLTMILKYALWRNDAGSCVSLGLGLTAPTGPEFATINGDFSSFLLQPFVGYRWSADRYFVQGFSSLVIPTNTQDPTLLFNDLGVGYMLYRAAGDRPLSFVAPTIEAHLTTPLDHRSVTDAVVVPDLLVLTGGVQLGLFRRATLNLGAATPITGPRLFNVEAIGHLNIRF
jgi:hypothetical protein